MVTLLLGGLAACGSLPPPPLRPEPLAHADTLPIAEPEAREPSEAAELFQAGVLAPASRALEPRRWVGREREALNLTRWDDVVPSAWFEPRNGVRRMSPEEVARGPAVAPPDTAGALTVIRPKAGGAMPGFWVRDSRGREYLVKLDPPGYPRLASAADVITSRLLHAAGYHVPGEFAVLLRPERLEIAPEMEEGGRRLGGPRPAAAGDRPPMTRADLEAELARGARLPDGRAFGVASARLPGTPKGPWLFEGRRSDDPNDRFPHEHRRELRGLHVVAAWLNHIDLRFQNTLSVWIDPPGYLRHHLIDFSSSLGSGGTRPHLPREGREHNVDLWASVARLVTLGFHEVGWEGEPAEVDHPSVGWLPVESFEPGAWKPNWPNGAWAHLTPADGYWGAKLVGSFTDRQLAAAVAAAGLPAEAAETLTDALARRRDRTVAYWYARVTPLERPRIEPAGRPGIGSAGPIAGRTAASAPVPGEAFQLSFDDLGLAGPRAAPATTYRWELRHEALGRRWRGMTPARGRGRQRIRVGPPEVSEDGALAARGDVVGRPSEHWSALPHGASTDPADPSAYALLRVTAEREGADGRPATLWLHWRGPELGYAVAALRH